MTRPPSKATLAARKQFAIEAIRAAHLQAKQRVITAKIDAIKAERMKAA